MPLIIGNKQIDTPIKDLLELLQQQLYMMHIDKLGTVSYKHTDALISCPVHKEGRERTPSCSILLEDRIQGGKVIPAGTVHCFACDYRATFVQFIVDCTGVSYKKAKDWILGVSRYSLVEERRAINLDIEVGDSKQNNYDTLPIITEEELQSYEYYHPYMTTRKLSPEVIDRFEVGYDPKLDALTFPVYIGGECLFVAKRRVKFKRFEMPEIYPKPIYGLDYCNHSDPIYVCESIINALTLWSYGKQAVALLGTGSSEQAQMLNSIPQRSLILALDGDEAGEKGCQRLKKALSSKLLTRLDVPTDGRDINDLTKEEFESLDEIIL